MERIGNLWDLLSKNSFLGALVSGLLIVLVGWLINLVVTKYRSSESTISCKVGCPKRKRAIYPQLTCHQKLVTPNLKLNRFVVITKK